MSDQIQEEIEAQEEVETAPSEHDFDNMSDDDFLNLDAGAAGVGMPDVVRGPSQTLEDKLDSEILDAEEAPAEAGAPEEDGDQPSDEAAASSEGTEVDGEDHTTPHQSEDASQEPAKEAEKPAAEDGEKAEPQDFEALYKQVMAPFKANGKEFAPSSPEEAMRLMQMGANYTKKMQTLAPNLKLMRMLENNGLLEESKLNFLIDLEKKNPEAIKKLLHDGKIDPLDLDTSSEPAYTPGNHSVSDQEMAFHDVLGNVMATPTGKETVSHVNSQWDHDSKQAIYREPQLLAIIDEQRSNGLYATISAEVERRRVLGDLQNVPFIVAYKQVGDELFKAGKLQAPGDSAAQQTPAQAPVTRPVLDTRPATRKPAVTNGDKARAISSPPKAAKATSAPALDPFSMSDEEIMRITSLKV
jgi:hypothetical protein